MTRIICGVDVSSTTLDARIGRDGARGQFPRTLDGIAALAAFCRHQHAALAVMEASGGYERLPFGQLWGEDIPVAIVNPRAVRRFAEAVGQLEKTDRLDCAIIAWYAETRAIEPTPPASAAQQQLTALVVRLRQLTRLQTEQKNQRRLVNEPGVLAGFTALLAEIARQRRALRRQIQALLDADPLWAALDQAFREIKGVAFGTVAEMMAEMPEIGTVGHKAAAKLTGVAPIARDSGQRQGKRKVRGGRAGVRSILFVVVRKVCEYDETFRAFRDRLKAAGKPYKVIRIALAHKLLVRLNAKARDVRRRFAVTQAQPAWFVSEFG